MEATQTAATQDRRLAIADAALLVLEREGGRGLTHRAVDRAAEIPQGSTSNYFPTREALLEAALQRLVELERPAVEALEALVAEGPFAPRRAAELVAATVLAAILDPGRTGLAVARHELVLEARRRPEFQLAFDAVRRDYLAITERLLPAAGCKQPHEHAPQLLALLEGLVFWQLFESLVKLPEEAVLDQLERFFASC